MTYEIVKELLVITAIASPRKKNFCADCQLLMKLNVLTNTDVPRFAKAIITSIDTDYAKDLR
jgi:hypothetical protein